MGMVGFVGWSCRMDQVVLFLVVLFAQVRGCSSVYLAIEILATCCGGRLQSLKDVTVRSKRFCACD